MRYRVNAPQVISETIDGETVIIHLGTGCYYSVQDDVGGIWRALAGSWSTEDIAEALQHRFDISPDELASIIDQLVAELRVEELILPAEGGTPDPGSAPERSDGSGRQPMMVPRLSKYTDMQDLVLLDPVHEVTDAGWPQRQEGGIPAPGAVA